MGAVLLILFGTQWYILFNVAGSAAAIPNDIISCAAILRLSGWNRWRKFLLPAILPGLVTGWITAAGGAWNATIVSEIVPIGRQDLRGHRPRRLHHQREQRRQFLEPRRRGHRHGRGRRRHQPPRSGSASRTSPTTAAGSSPDPIAPWKPHPRQPLIELRHVSHEYFVSESENDLVLSDVNLTVSENDDGRAPRALGLRQVDAGADHGRADHADHAARCSTRASSCVGVSPGRLDGVPELRALSLAHRAGQRAAARSGTSPRRSSRPAWRRSCRRSASAPTSTPIPRELSGGMKQRVGHRPRPDRRARGARDGRALQRAGRPHRRDAAQRDRPAARRPEPSRCARW